MKLFASILCLVLISGCAAGNQWMTDDYYQKRTAEYNSAPKNKAMAFGQIQLQHGGKSITTISSSGATEDSAKTQAMNGCTGLMGSLMAPDAKVQHECRIVKVNDEDIEDLYKYTVAYANEQQESSASMWSGIAEALSAVAGASNAANAQRSANNLAAQQRQLAAQQRAAQQAAQQQAAQQQAAQQQAAQLAAQQRAAQLAAQQKSTAAISTGGTAKPVAVPATLSKGNSGGSTSKPSGGTTTTVASGGNTGGATSLPSQANPPASVASKPASQVSFSSSGSISAAGDTYVLNVNNTGNVAINCSTYVQYQDGDGNTLTATPTVNNIRPGTGGSTWVSVMTAPLQLLNDPQSQFTCNAI